MNQNQRNQLNNKKINEEIEEITKQKSWPIPKDKLANIEAKRKGLFDLKDRGRKLERQIKMMKLEQEVLSEALWEHISEVMPEVPEEENLCFSDDKKSIELSTRKGKGIGELLDLLGR